MLFRKYKNIRIIDIIRSITLFFMLSGVLLFIVESIHTVTQSNENTFKYIVKVRNSIEEIDKIIERSEVNIRTLTDIIIESYDISKRKNRKYNIEFSKTLDIMTKVALINSPGVYSTWFQSDRNTTFSPYCYAWYGKSNGKVVNLREIVEKANPEERKITPEDDPYYFEAIKAKKLIWSSVYTDADTKVPMISIVQPVYKNGFLIGVSGIDVSIDNLQNALVRMQSKFQKSEIFIVDNKGKVLVSQFDKDESDTNDADYFLPLFKRNSKQLSAEDEQMVEYNDNGVKKTAIKLDLTNNYELIITFPNDVVFKGFNRLFNTVYLIFFAMAILGITALKIKSNLIRLNKSLNNERNILRTIIDSAPAIIVLKDDKGVFTDCNNKFLELFGEEKINIIGKKACDFWNNEIVNQITQAEEIVKTTGKASIVDFSCHRNNGKILNLEQHILPLFDDSNNIKGLLIIAFDVTKIKHQQDLLKKAKESAENTTKMKSNFLANMSHEIRTPMNGVLGFLQLLKDTNLTKEQDEFLTDAQKASEALLDIINDILDFSKIEAEKLRIENISFDVRSIVEDVTLLATANADKKDIEVNSLICSDVPQKLFGDPSRIKQILNNLVSNAIKFTDKGEVVIYVKQIWEDANNSVISFKVKDTGIGIAEDQLKIIFEAFTQADASTTRKFGGTGLGLAISTRLSELMNGSISAGSKLGEGSTFTFIIPLEKDKQAISEINESYKLLNGTKILVVDSSPTDLKIINYYLSEINCTIYKAEDATTALNILESHGDDISVIIIDYKMHGVAGNDLSSVIKSNEKYKDIPLILYTSLLKRGNAKLAKEKGYSDYLIKPIKKQELVDTIVNVISNKDAKKHLSTTTELQEYKFSEDIRILAVEDSDINCRLIAQILASHGLSCDLAYNGKEAIERIKNINYDLVLMDCQMPILNGYEATKEIRKLEGDSKRTPVIAMTANAMSEDEDKCYEAGMDDYISKPINVEELLRLITKYLKFESEFVTEVKSHIEAPQIVKEEVTDDKIDEIIEDINKELGFEVNDAKELLIQFLDYLPHCLSEFEFDINEKDYEQLKKDAHKLKGASANLRIKKMAKLALSLEKSAKDNDEQTCLYVIDDIKNYSEYLNTLILKFVKL